MDDKDFNILKMLFEEHHRQLVGKRQKIHSMTERTLTILLLIAGWLIFAKNPMTLGVRWVIIGLVLVVALWACKSIYNSNRAWYEVADVIRRLNQALGLHDQNRFIHVVEAVYPPKWKTFGKVGKLGNLGGALSHILAILGGTVLCVFAAWMRT